MSLGCDLNAYRADNILTATTENWELLYIESESKLKIIPHIFFDLIIWNIFIVYDIDTVLSYCAGIERMNGV